MAHDLGVPDPEAPSDEERRLDICKPCTICTAGAFYYCGHYRPSETPNGVPVAQGQTKPPADADGAQGDAR